MVGILTTHSSPMHHDLPPTTVSAARPARNASPSPRSTAGSTVPGHQVGVHSRRERPSRREVPAACAAATVYLGRPPPGRASPPDAIRAPAPRRIPSAPAPRTRLRADRSKRPARRCRTPSPSSAAAGSERHRRRGPGRPSDGPPAGCRSGDAPVAWRRRSPARAARADIGGVDALEVLDPMRQPRRAGARSSRSSARRTAASPIACAVTAMPLPAAVRMASRASASVVIGMPRSRLRS